MVITFDLDGFKKGREIPVVLNPMERYLGGIAEASATIRNR
jgi:hypothetical protein